MATTDINTAHIQGAQLKYFGQQIRAKEAELRTAESNKMVKKEEGKSLISAEDIEVPQLTADDADDDVPIIKLINSVAEVVNNAPVDGLDVTVGANEKKNVFRKDEIKVFKDNEALLQNAPSKEQNMFKIPKVIN